MGMLIKEQIKKLSNKDLEIIVKPYIALLDSLLLNSKIVQNEAEDLPTITVHYHLSYLFKFYDEDVIIEYYKRKEDIISVSIDPDSILTLEAKTDIKYPQFKIAIQDEEKKERNKAIQTISNLYPLNSIYPETKKIAEELLIKAINRIDFNWEDLPLPLLKAYAKECEYKENEI